MQSENDSHQAIEEASSPLSPRTIIVIFVLLLAGSLALVAVTSAPEFLVSRFLTVGVIFLILGLALFDHLYEVVHIERAWRKLADRTGLRCQVSGFLLFGYAVQVTGHYRGHKLALSTYKQGKSQAPSTRIALSLTNETNASLRLRGPFKPGEAGSDKVVSDLFGAIEARQFGDDKRFFIRSRPVHLVTTMFRPGPLRARLSKLESLINIELEGPTLHFNQLGVLGNMDYLEFIFELLADVADTVERGGYVKLTSSISNQ